MHHVGARTFICARHVVRRHIDELKFSRRSYSIVVKPQYEEIRVNVGSSGHVDLRIYNSKPLKPNDSERCPVVVHLSNSLAEPLPKALLNAKTTLVTVLPRWSPQKRWPLPLHDVSTAYEFITTNICTTKIGYTQHTTTTQIRPISVMASGHRSSLALSLALSECRRSDAHHVSAVALRDGIYDYSLLARQVCPATADTQTSSFYEDMKSLFVKPAHTFDPFVSPKLWFLSAGVHIPTLWPGEEAQVTITKQDAYNGLMGFSEEDDDPLAYQWDSYPHVPSSSSPSATGKTITSVDLSPTATKSSYLTYQTKGSGLILPYIRLSVSETLGKKKVQDATAHLRGGKRAKRQRFHEGNWEDLKAEQAIEMARLLRRSVSMHEIKDRNGGIDVGGGNDEALARIDLVGLDSEEDDVDGVWAAEWFRDVI